MVEARKATFVLPAVLLAQVRHLVEAGLAESASALVREAVEERVRQLREEELAREFREAARDPLFLADLEETEEAFAVSVADGLRPEG